MARSGLDQSDSLRGDRIAALCLAAALLTVTHRAAAQSSESHADELFRQGQALMQAGRPREACARLGDSLRLDPALGTLLNLALCHEREGRVATAYREYGVAAMWARQRRERDREQFATGRVLELEKNLSKLHFDLAGAPLHLAVKLDGRLVEAAELEAGIAVDPGSHRLEVTGEGRAAASRRDLWIELPGVTVVRLAFDGQTHRESARIRATVDAMTLEGASFTASTGDAALVEPSSGRSAFGYVIGGAGVASLGVGVALLLRAGALDAESERDAERARTVNPPDPASKAAALEHHDAAITSQNLGLAAAGIGILGVSTSLYLLLSTHPTERSAPRGTMRILPRLAPNAAGVQLEARF